MKIAARIPTTNTPLITTKAIMKGYAREFGSKTEEAWSSDVASVLVDPSMLFPDWWLARLDGVAQSYEDESVLSRRGDLGPPKNPARNNEFLPV